MDPVLTVDAAAQLVRCEPDTLRAQAAEFGGLKIGRDWIFPTETFLAVLNEKAQASRARRKATPPPAPQAVVTTLKRRAPPQLP